MSCPRCLARAYGAVLDSHGFPNAQTSASRVNIQMLTARRFIHSGRKAKGSIRRPGKIFAAPPSTAVDRRGKPLTRGGEKPLSERKMTKARALAGGVRTPVEDRDMKRNKFFDGDRRELAVTSASREKKVDRAKIAAAVEKALNGTSKEHEEAIDLLRELTSQYGRKDLVVAWNHVIEWKLKRGNVNMGMKIYNEMKKRGTKPDTYTYLRLLNGLAENAPSVPGALGRALTVYYSMTAPSSTVKPTIIHTNAALKVCAQAKDIDAMWDIAERIPDTGRSQADTLTYTTLLNGIRNGIEGSPDRFITEGRELWENILLKWEKGFIQMDEGLGCAMARLLLRSGRAEDWDEVLSLFQDVFGVPRLIPKIGTKARKLLPVKDLVPGKVLAAPEVDPKAAAQQAQEQGIDLQESLKAAIKSVGAGKLKSEDNTLSDAEDIESEESTSLVVAMADGSNTDITTQIPAKKAPIGNNGLSILMETCLALRAYDTATNYWELITESYNVVPDRDNYHGRMRILSQLSDSSGCVSLIEDMITNGIELNQNLFFIALNGCRRAKKITGFNDALKILDLMQKHQVEVTSKVIIAFIRAATVTEDLEVLKRAWMRVGPGMFNIHKLIDPTDKSIEKISRDLEACQELVSLSDAILSRMFQKRLDKAEREFADQVTGSRGKIQKYVNEYFNNRKENSEEPDLVKKVQSYRREVEVPKEDHKKKLTLDKSGRWGKPRAEQLGPGEESLKGIEFRRRERSGIADKLRTRERQPVQTRSFMGNNRTDFTAHYKPGFSRGNASNPSGKRRAPALR
ncbi:hypothetical protein ABW19_dt0205807 [Dactylella cylindrospora]|nr:hypothetical protein ABW19_dt0205807 [Dactylella cylindrospora]